jgi:hypothetical protein
MRLGWLARAAFVFESVTPSNVLETEGRNQVKTSALRVVLPAGLLCGVLNALFLSSQRIKGEFHSFSEANVAPLYSPQPLSTLIIATGPVCAPDDFNFL